MKTRIGVFVCRCGNNIGGVIDIPKVLEEAKSIPNVILAEEFMYACSEDSLTTLEDRIKAHRLNRVVVAACTPRTHEPLFKRCCEEAGLNKYLFEFVNIREHCAWIHPHEKAEATNKAASLVRMGIAKAFLLQAREDIKIDITPSALIIGGGVAGITSALNLAKQGFEVHLVEKNDHLGGVASNFNILFPDMEGGKKLSNLIQSFENNENITLHLSSKVKDCEGNLGKFNVIIKDGSEDLNLIVGTIVIATGAGDLKPHGLYRYGQLSNVVTQMEYETLSRKRNGKYKNVVMINCVGARVTERPYCSQICCMTSIKNAILLKELNPYSAVTILHRDILAYGTSEEYYRNAMEKGISFSRYSIENPPQVLGDGSADSVRYYNELVGKTIDIPCDLVVLSTPLVPQDDNDSMAKLFKVPITEDKFFLEAHQKLRPVEFATEGIYICGSARWPVDIRESIAQGYAAAAKAAIPMRKGRISFDTITASCNEKICSGCGSCVEVCTYNAIDYKDLGGDRRVVEVNQVQCKGCGCCVSACKNGTMQQNGFSDYQLISMIEMIA
jgi:heterodisulfide reductase subunit A